MIDKIIMQERDVPVDVEEIESFEKLLGRFFPDDFRKFLINYNGGRPARQSILFDGSKLGINGETISFFYGFGGFSENIRKSYLMLEDCMPEMLVPIANTPDGSHFLLSLKKDGSYGKIYYCDHELQSDDEEFNEAKNIYPECMVKVANSFTELLSNLIAL